MFWGVLGRYEAIRWGKISFWRIWGDFGKNQLTFTGVAP
ncbi:hypothetical protein KIT04_009 [Vibrio phage KIT04]|nr:hypothetical protein KIT04_009 [Vibrio phage KIT04]